MSATLLDTSRGSPCDDSLEERRVGAVDGRPVGAGQPRRQTSRPAGSDALDVGVAELPELDVEPEADDAGGGADVDGRGPTEPPRRGHHRYRPDRPPLWMRLLLYGAMLIACFLIGMFVGKVWTRIDRAAWGPY
jgi:hypothetical protein